MYTETENLHHFETIATLRHHDKVRPPLTRAERIPAGLRDRVLAAQEASGSFQLHKLLPDRGFAARRPYGLNGPAGIQPG